MKVEALMTRAVRSCSPHDSLNTAARLMWEGDCGCVPVTLDADDGSRRVVGVITDRDVCMGAYTQGRALADIAVSTVMAQKVCSCSPRDNVEVALKVLASNRLHRLPVIEDDRLVGLISLSDILREARREQAQKKKGIAPEAILAALEAICEPRTPRELVAA
jgi:CBS domain-containing protein